MSKPWTLGAPLVPSFRSGKTPTSGAWSALKTTMAAFQFASHPPGLICSAIIDGLVVPRNLKVTTGESTFWIGPRPTGRREQTKMRKLLLSTLLGCALIGGANAAEVYVRVGPPHPVVEHRRVAPGPGYVWTPGYHRWDGRAYVWQPGVWVRAPRQHAVWVPHHWVHRRGGWVLVEGHWR